MAKSKRDQTGKRNEKTDLKIDRIQERGHAVVVGSEAISTALALAAKGETPDWSEDIGGEYEDQGFGIEDDVRWIAGLGVIQDFAVEGNEDVRAGQIRRVADLRPGHAMPLEDIPVGTVVHNLELRPGKGGQLVRAAGTSAQIVAKEGSYASVRLPSGEVRRIHERCMATIGQVGNTEHGNINLGKAGRKRWLGWRPTVRGTAQDPASHPHGGGEGRTGVGMPAPKTPWGKPALGVRTRKYKRSDVFIVRRRGKKRRKR